MKTRKPKPSRSSIFRRVARLRELHSGSAEALQVFATLDNGDPNPFDLVTPTKNNFASIPEAIDYYQIRLDVCVKASALLKQAAELCSKVVDSSERAANEFAKLKAADLAELGVPPELQAPALRAWNSKVAPMAETFAGASKAYDDQGSLLLRTVAALRRGMLEVVK